MKIDFLSVKTIYLASEKWIWFYLKKNKKAKTYFLAHQVNYYPKESTIETNLALW